MFPFNAPKTATLGRRRFVTGAASVGAASLFGAASFPPTTGRAAAQTATSGLIPASASGFALTVHEIPVDIAGTRARSVGINGTMPAPTLRWREGDEVSLTVSNRLRETTSIHWHGIRLPANMDGVPGLSFAGIAPGESFTYRFPVRQSGTYWYHSHSGGQEQAGLYGAIVIDPLGKPAYEAERDYVVVLSDWTDADAMDIVSNLKQNSDYYNFRQRTVGTFLHDAREGGLGAAVRDRLRWGAMNMAPTDISDVSGVIYTYLMNGHAPDTGWTGLFRPGERVRLRFINAASMTLFDVRIPSVTMSIVGADGNDVAAVSVDEFRIAPAETYDVIVRPEGVGPYTIFVQSEDRTGYARGTLAVQDGARGPIPAMDPRPLRTMTDMGMGMDGMPMEGMKMPSPAPAGVPPAMPDMPGMDMGEMKRPAGISASTRRRRTPTMVMDGMGAMPMPHPADQGTGGSPPVASMTPGVDHRPKIGVEVQSVAENPINRLGEAGDGLDGDGRRALKYTDLRALRPGADPRPPSREIILHLTGNMERFIWGFDGRKFSEAPPIELALNERVRFTLVNDTMMEHPIHLHGFWSELENGQGDYRPYKHTIIVKPGEKLSYLVTVDVAGLWAYHCHLLYHMDTGMFRTVVVS